VWSFALHSFRTALGEVEMPFFGASQKQKRGKRRKSTPFFAVPLGVFSPVPCLGRGAGGCGGSAQK
jgi:hypothetical protein